MFNIKWLMVISASLLSLGAHALIVPGNLTVIDLKSQGIDGVALELKGAIAYPIASEYEQAMAQVEPGRKIFLNFDSEGGVVDEGEKIIAILKAEKAKGRQFISLVTNGEICASMCVPIFLQGQERRAHEVSAFMFHGSYAGMYTNIPNKARTLVLLNIFTEAGVSQGFLDSLWEKGAFSEPGEYWMSGRELWDEKAGIITKLQSRHKKYEPWTAPIDPNIRPR